MAATKEYRENFISKYAPVLEISVGKPPKGVVFAIHKNQLASWPFFLGIFKDQASTNMKIAKLELPDEDPAIFSFVVDIIHEGCNCFGTDEYLSLDLAGNVKLYRSLQKYNATWAEHHLKQFEGFEGCYEGELSAEIVYFAQANLPVLSKLRQETTNFLILTLSREPERAKEFKRCFKHFPDLAVLVTEELATSVRDFEKMRSQGTRSSRCSRNEHNTALQWEAWM